MSIGSRIKELREERDLTRSEFANLIGVTVGAVSNYENEVSSPKEPILFKIIEVLGCDANYLFQDAIKMSPIVNDVSVKEYNFIEQYRELDDEGKETVDYILEKEYRRVIKERTMNPRQLVIDMDNPEKLITMEEWMSRQQDDSLKLSAAHERTDIEVTDEMRKHDDDIMDSENF